MTYIVILLSLHNGYSSNTANQLYFLVSPWYSILSPYYYTPSLLTLYMYSELSTLIEDSSRALVFNNISVISWRSVLLVEETGAPGENHRPVASHWHTLCCIEYILPWTLFKLTTFMVIVTHCTGSCKSNYHMIKTRTAHEHSSRL